VLGNDDDPAGTNDPLTIVAANTVATRGTVSLSGGQLRYSPDGFFESLGAGETAVDSFEYTISDGDGGTATAKVCLTIHGQNDAPIAVGSLPDVTVNQNEEPTIIDLTGLFADADANDVLTITAVSSTSSPVTATVAGNTLTLHYLADQSGTATITVTAKDPHSAIGSVSFAVHVLSPVEQAAEVQLLINGWQAGGSINAGQSDSLKSMIKSALVSYVAGNVIAAKNQCNALKNEIRALVRPGGLTQLDADLAIALIDDLIDSLRL